MTSTVQVVEKPKRSANSLRLLKGGGQLMNICNRDFAKPSREARVLAILHALAENPSVSQNELGQRTNLSGAMVNSYLKELADQGLIEYLPRNGKSFNYALTDQGKEVQNKLFMRYCTEIIQSYTAIKLNIRTKLLGLLDQGISRLVFFGASETCEVALTAVQDNNLKIVAIVDNDPFKHGRLFHGYVISSPAILESIQCQALIITSFGAQSGIHDQVKPLAERKQWKIVSL